jgi:flagellar basal body rod protein FlgB
MTFTPETVLGKKVLDLTTFRHQLIANNISNANTPKYKRTDVSFAETLENLGDKTRGIEVNTPPDLLLRDIVASDVSKGKKLTYLHGNSDGDLGIDFARGSLSFDSEWYQQGLDASVYPKDRNLTTSEVIDELDPIIIKTKNSERLDGNNVNVDLEISEMIKNTSYYNMLTSIVSGDFRIYRTIISAR